MQLVNITHTNTRAHTHKHTQGGICVGILSLQSSAGSESFRPYWFAIHLSVGESQVRLKCVCVCVCVFVCLCVHVCVVPLYICEISPMNEGADDSSEKSTHCLPTGNELRVRERRREIGKIWGENIWRNHCLSSPSLSVSLSLSFSPSLFILPLPFSLFFCISFSVFFSHALVSRSEFKTLKITS